MSSSKNMVCDLIHSVKSPWGFIDNPTDANLLFTDLGNLKFAHIGESCPVNSEQIHPGFIFNHPVAKLHVTLENQTDPQNPKILWDAEFEGTRGSAHGGPAKLLPNAPPTGGTQQVMLPVCARNYDDFALQKLKLRLEELPRTGNTDYRFPHRISEYTITPRPLGDKIIYADDIKNRILDFFHHGDFQTISQLCLLFRVLKKNVHYPITLQLSIVWLRKT